ncbi:MAG: DUF6427 family protein [Salinivirgaceae bacterium]|jgi:hypothetical protein|nr:DUF6427 family protein [Salinivirgaceae bacterium]
MFVRLLKGHEPSNILLIVLFSALLWLKPIMELGQVPQEFFAPFLDEMYVWANQHYIFSAIILFFLILFEAFYMVRLNFEYIFIDKRTYFPALVYVLWMTFFIGTEHFAATVFSNFFILFAIQGILKTQIGKLNIRMVFNSGLLIGLASLFYWPALLIALPIWFFTLILHGTNWRGLIAQVIGILVPWLFIMTWYYLNEQSEILNYLTHKLQAERIIPLGKNFTTYKLYLLLALLLSAFMYHFRNLINKKIVVRKYYSGMMWYFLVITAGLILIPSAGEAGIATTAIPATLFLSNQYLTTKRSFFAEVNFGLIVAASVIWVYLL